MIMAILSTCLLALFLFQMVSSAPIIESTTNLSSSSIAEASTNPPRHRSLVVMQLIHTDSVAHRTNLLHKNPSLFYPTSNLFSPAIPDSNPDNKKYFYVKVRIGSLRIVQDLIIDTGSSLTWVSCSPSIYARMDPYYPIDSSTYDSISFHRQLKFDKFGHCISNITDPNNFDHQLLMGDDLDISSSAGIVQRTPLTIRQGKYTVLLKRFTFGGKFVGNDPIIYTGGMILDTGSTLTFLPEAVVQVLEGFIEEEMQKLDMSRNDTVVYPGVSKTYKRLCYNGRLYNKVADLFPDVKFVFDRDAYMFLEPANFFQQYYPDLLCLAIVPSEPDYGKIVLGNLMMQNFYYVYDTHQGMLSFGLQCCAMEPRCFPDMHD